MTGNGRKNDDLIANALACGQTTVNAAKQASVSERTVYRRLEDRAFRRRVLDIRRQMLAEVAGAITSASLRAVSTLDDLLKADSEAVSLGAARSILALGIRLREVAKLEERVRSTEDALDFLDM